MKYPTDSTYVPLRHHDVREPLGVIRATSKRDAIAWCQLLYSDDVTVVPASDLTLTEKLVALRVQRLADRASHDD